MPRSHLVSQPSIPGRAAGARPCRGVLRCVRHAALAGLALVLVWPAARGSSEWVGWLPLWLVGMPLSAWWAVLRFPLPRWTRRRPQARRVHRAPRSGPLRATRLPLRTA